MSRRLSAVTWLAVVLASAAPHGRADAQTKQAARPPAPVGITFAEGRISFQAPPGFTVLTGADMATKFGAGAPRQAVGNPGRTTIISYDLMTDRANANALEAARKHFTTTIGQALPGLKWVLNTVDKIGTRDWAHLEYTAPAGEQGVLYQILLIGVYDGRVLMFTFNSPVMEFPRNERAFRTSMATITAKP